MQGTPPITALAVVAALLAPIAALAQGVAGPYLAAEEAARRGDLSAASHFLAEVIAQDPENADVIERSLTYHVGAGQFQQALTLAEGLQQIRPGHHLGILILAADAIRGGDFARADALLSDDGEETTPFVGLIMQAWAKFGAGDADAAFALLLQIEEDSTGGVAGELIAAYHIGLIAAATGDDARAVEALDRAAEKAGNGTLKLARIRAGGLARLGRADEALALLSEQLELRLGDQRIEALSATIEGGAAPEPEIRTSAEGAAEALFGVSGFLSRGQNQLVGLAYARLATYLDPTSIEAHLTIAEILEALDQHALVVEAYSQIPEDAPEALDAQIGRARALQELGQIEEAVAAMRHVVDVWPETIESHTALADMFRRESRFAEAAEAYTGAIALIGAPEQRHWPIYYQRGVSYERAKAWEQAEDDFLFALELEPDQPLVLNYLGYSWVEMGRNIQRAREMIEKAVEQRPEDGYIVDSLGWVLYRLGQFEEAVPHLERAVELRPVDPIINDHFGDALWMVGRRTEAVFQWRRALSFEPEEQEVVDRIRRKLEVGLDVVLEEEAAAGKPAILGASETDAAADDGG